MTWVKYGILRVKVQINVCERPLVQWVEMYWVSIHSTEKYTGWHHCCVNIFLDNQSQAVIVQASESP